MNNTFIFLSRSILDSEVFASPELLRVWVWCLCRANYKDNYVSWTGFDTIKVERGQFITGRKKAAEELKINESLFYRCLKKLQQIKNINIKSNNKYSIVTVLNYDKYQLIDNYIEQQANSKRTTSEQQVNTDNKDNNVNKDKKVNTAFSVFWNLYDKKVGDKNKIEKKWNKLANEERQLIIDHIPKYKNAQPDKQFRKNPETFLNSKGWEDELIGNQVKKAKFVF